MVLDEPTEGLDQDTADALLRELPALLGDRSLLLITHGVLPESLTLGQRTLEDVFLALVGTPATEDATGEESR